MKILRIALVSGDKEGIGYEMIAKVLAAPELLEICTPVVFGQKQNAFAAVKRVPMETPLQYNVVKHAGEISDGKANFIDGFASEEEALSAAIKAYMSNQVDIIVTIPGELCNDIDHHTLRDFLCKAVEADPKDVFDWEICGNIRTLILHPVLPDHELGEGVAIEAFMNDLTNINKSLRKDYTLIKPRIAVVAKLDKLKKDLVELREHGVWGFGPFDAKEFVESGNYTHYDASLFLEDEKKELKNLLDKLESANTFGYISGLPMVFTYPHKTSVVRQENNVDDTPLRNAIYSAIDIYRNRSSYRHATRKPLEKQWVPKGRDDFKLDLSKDTEE